MWNTLNLPGGASGGQVNDEILEDSIEPFNYKTSDLFRYNGNLKWVSRHGVFWIAFAHVNTALYKINLIDFHELTSNGVSTESTALSFDNIPNKLENNYDPNSWSDDNGIINVTIPDQEFGPNRVITD